MSTLNRAAYQRLIDEDLVWLFEQPRTLERDHIECVLRSSVASHYDPPRGAVQPGTAIKPEGYLADDEGTLP